MELVIETEKSLSLIEEDSKPYVTLAEWAATLLNSFCKLKLEHLSFSVTEMMSLLSKEFMEVEGMGYQYNKECLATVILHIKYQLTRSVFRLFGQSLSTKQRLVVLLFIMVQWEVKRGMLSAEEKELLLGAVPCSMMKVLEHLGSEDSPSWITEQVQITLFVCQTYIGRRPKKTFSDDSHNNLFLKITVAVYFA